MEQRITRIAGIMLATAIMMIGCKSGKQLAESEPVSTRQLVSMAIEAQPVFHTLDLKRIALNVSLGSSSYSSPASCRIIRDSVIHLSIQPFFGVEMMVAQFTADRFVLLDKVRKVVYAGDYASLRAEYGIAVDFKTIQALITNQLFVMSHRNTPLTALKPERGGSTNFLLYQEAGISHRFQLNNDHRILKTQLTTAGGRQQLTAEYDKFTSQGLLLFPSQYSVKVTTGESNFNLGVSVSRLSYNEPVSIPQLSLQGYRSGSLESLLN
jgi:hypothetical protein